MWWVCQVTIAADTSARAAAWVLWRVQRVQTDATLVAVEDGVLEGIDALVLVELAVDTAALGWVREVAQDELGLHEPAVVLQRGREAAAALLGVQEPDEQARGDRSVV
jgi:hypothetical protein